jgi:hypothetical protein
MKRISVIGLVILGLVAMPLVVAAAPNGARKMAVCHMPDDGGAPHEIVVNGNALKGHLDHGDLVGSCPSELPENTAPTAVVGFSSVCSFFAGCTIYLDGTGSTDPDGDALSYAWTVSGGASVTSTGPSFSFPGPAGEYGVTLTVSDGAMSHTASGYWFAP